MALTRWFSGEVFNVSTSFYDFLKCRLGDDDVIILTNGMHGLRNLNGPWIISLMLGDIIIPYIFIDIDLARMSSLDVTRMGHMWCQMLSQLAMGSWHLTHVA